MTIDSNRLPAKLERIHGKETEVVCLAPCNRVIDVPHDALFRVVPEGSRPTSYTGLHSPEDPVTWLDVRASPTWKFPLLRGTGIASTILGGLMVIGTLVAIPWVRDTKAINVELGVGTAGLALAFPIGLTLIIVSGAFESSDVTLRDPHKRPDLAIHF